uniref:Zinc finger protein n=1 Tax=Solanum tuberosum TaxID=4113 RepID=M0ZQ43_SOLTU
MWLDGTTGERRRKRSDVAGWNHRRERKGGAHSNSVDKQIKGQKSKYIGSG